MKRNVRTLVSDLLIHRSHVKKQNIVGSFIILSRNIEHDIGNFFQMANT